VPRAALDAWPDGEAEWLFKQRQAPNLTIRRHRSLGLRLDHDFFGAFTVAQDGTDVVCAPRDLPDWAWQRFLVGQILPLASALQGFEPFHASAVEVGGRAVLCPGGSGAGKSSVALHLVERGGRLLADDVAAVSIRGGRPAVHPGPALMSVDADEVASLGEDGPLRRWRRLGSLDDEVRLAGPGVVGTPVPVVRMFILTRRSTGPPVSIKPLDRPLGKVLLGATFNAYYREPERLFRQLEVCEALARSARVEMVASGPAGSARETAAAIAHRLERPD